METKAILQHLNILPIRLGGIWVLATVGKESVSYPSLFCYFLSFNPGLILPGWLPKARLCGLSVYRRALLGDTAPSTYQNPGSWGSVPSTQSSPSPHPHNVSSTLEVIRYLLGSLLSKRNQSAQSRDHAVAKNSGSQPIGDFCLLRGICQCLETFVVVITGGMY